MIDYIKNNIIDNIIKDYINNYINIKLKNVLYEIFKEKIIILHILN